MNKNSSFFAYLSRMKYIERWSLMKNTSKENVAEHSFHTAMLAHALGVINNVIYHGNLEPERLATFALFHEAAEVLTGDLPTPVKYANADIRTAYKSLEHNAEARLLKMLPSEFRASYLPVISGTQTSEAEKIVLKAADKLAALIKCMDETKSGNREFAKAENATLTSIHALACDEANYFIEYFLPSYILTLDELD